MLITMCFDLSVKHELLKKLFSSICHNYTGMLTNLKLEMLCKMLAGSLKTATIKLTLAEEQHLRYHGLYSLTLNTAFHPGTQNLCMLPHMKKKYFGEEIFTW